MCVGCVSLLLKRAPDRNLQVKCDILYRRGIIMTGVESQAGVALRERGVYYTLKVTMTVAADNKV